MCSRDFGLKVSNLVAAFLRNKSDNFYANPGHKGGLQAVNAVR